ncbi:MAG: capsule assembly Wzi family protein [Ginsengibacter sp.]
MQIIKSVITLTVFFLPLFIIAQTTYLPEGSKELHFIDRMEIKRGQNTDLNFSTDKPYSRKAIVAEAEYMDSINNGHLESLTGNEGGEKKSGHLTAIDRYNLHSLLMNNSEWVTGEQESFMSRSPILKNFYVTKPNLLEVNTPDFFLAINPVLNLQVGGESGNDQSLYYNKRGVTLRGRIGNKIGFSTTITDNQERGPLFFKNRVAEFNAVPGVGFYKKFKSGGYDYFDGRGYFTFNATKYIDIQFGYDKNFIGNGYRSLFLSDFGDSYLFLKLNTRIWKFNYENLFMELMPEYLKAGDNLLDRKYAAMHHLSMNVTKWLNVGLFEGVVFGRKNRFDFEYLNPIIFLRHVEGTVGSPDNAVAGIDFKANVAHQFQIYGQLLLDEFLVNEIAKNNGYWANKYGYQLGVKYIDAFKINNLDLQLETNRVRPFTYSHYDSVANYTHYNQPLAHPLGANFQEWVGVLKYQLAPKWTIDAKAIYYYQGLDSLGENFGSNPFELYTTRSKSYGYYVGSGDKVKCLNASITLSYELKENLFIEGNALYRKYTGLNNSSIFNIGIRWNAARRDYNY